MHKAKAGAEPVIARSGGIRAALLGLLAAAALSMPATAHAQVPDREARSPQELLNWLYLDLAELAGPKAGDPAVWPDYLTRDTRRLYDKLKDLDAAAGYDTFDYDWLCQCRNRRHIKVPPRFTILDRPTRLHANVQVTVSLYAGAVTRLKVSLVDEDGWKIADIENEAGQRLRNEIVHGIEDHKHGRKPLRRQFPD